MLPLFFVPSRYGSLFNCDLLTTLFTEPLYPDSPRHYYPRADTAYGTDKVCWVFYMREELQ